MNNISENIIKKKKYDVEAENIKSSIEITTNRLKNATKKSEIAYHEKMLGHLDELYERATINSSIQEEKIEKNLENHN